MTIPTQAEPDLCVIGAGGAGFEAAIAGAALGLSVVVAERSMKDGRVGYDADAAAILRAMTDRRARPTPADATLLGHKLQTVGHESDPDRRLARLEAMNVKVIRAEARFLDERRIEIGGTSLKPRRTIIATGARMLGVDLPGLAAEDVTPLGGLDLVPALPRSLVLLGGKPGGVGLAQGLARLGIAVCILVDGSLLPAWDQELVDPLRRVLRIDGVVVRSAAEVSRVERVGDGFRIGFVGGDSLAVSRIVANGAEHPELEGLHPERAGIAIRDGRPTLTAALRTSNPRVYAIGGAAGIESMTAVPMQVGTVMRAAFFKLPARFAPHAVPRLVETDPGLASVGLNEAAAAEKGPIVIHRWPFAETEAARATGLTEGHIKVITDRRERILGVGIVGNQAADLIGFWSLALAQGLALRDVAVAPLPRSAGADINRRVLTSSVARRLGSPVIRRALALARWLG